MGTSFVQSVVSTLCQLITWSALQDLRALTLSAVPLKRSGLPVLESESDPLIGVPTMESDSECGADDKRISTMPTDGAE